MAMKVLYARWAPSGPNTIAVRVRAHLDTTKTVTDALGATVEDPAWCYERTWQVPARQPGESKAQVATRIASWMVATRPEFKIECLAVLDDMTTAGTLTIEGQAL